MKSLMVKVALPIILIFLFTYASAQQNQTESRDAEFYYNRGLAYANKGQYDQAISDCTNALEINPRYAHAYNNRGLAYEKKGQHDQAISDCTNALEINPRNAEAYNNRGIAYKNKGQYDQAISDYNKALEINPGFANAYNNRQIAYENKGQHDRAISDDTEAHGCEYSEARSNMHYVIIFFIVLALLIYFLLLKKRLKSKKQTEYLQKHFPAEKSYKENTSNKRRKLLELIAGFSGIGGGVGGIILFIKFIDIYYPELNIPHKASIIEIIIAFSVIMCILCIGMVIGYVVALFVLRPFFTKEELSESERDLSVLIDMLWHPITALRMVIMFIFLVSFIALPQLIPLVFVKIVYNVRSIPFVIRIIIALIGSLLLAFVTSLALRLLMKLKKPLQLVLRSWIYVLIRIFFRPRLTTGATKTRNKTRAD